MRFRASALAVCSLLLCHAAPASAYCLYDPSGATTSAAWKNFPVKYKISSNLTDANIIAAIDAAFATWGSVACSKLKFVKDGTFDINAFTWNTHNQEAILVFWYTTAAGWPDDPKYAAMWFVGHDNAGGLKTASVAVNGFNQDWATDGDAQKLDVQSELTTQIGGAIGLSYSNSSDTVMKQSISYGDVSKHTLKQDDIDAIHYLYNETNCPAAPAPSTSCGGTPPPPKDGGTPTTDGTTPTTDGTTPTTDGTTPTTDGTTPTMDGGVPTSDGGGQACTSSGQCPDGQICSVEGKCVSLGGSDDDGGCCAVSAGAPPPGVILLSTLLLGLYLATRRRLGQNSRK